MPHAAHFVGRGSPSLVKYCAALTFNVGVALLHGVVAVARVFNVWVGFPETGEMRVLR